MNRKKLIITAVLGAFGLMAVYMVVNSLLLGPLAAKDLAIEARQREVNQLQDQNSRVSIYTNRISAFAARTFETDELMAKELSRARLAMLIEQAGLPAEQTSLTPLPVVKKSREGYSELGWTVKTRGSVAAAVNLLYLLQREPYLCRVENLNIAPIQRSTQIDLSLRYVTLVVEQQRGESYQTGLAVQGDAQPPSLNDPDRRRYEVIADRDLFRPYIQRPAPPPPPPPPPQARQDPPPPPTPADGRLKLVSLSQFGNEVEVCILDSRSQEVRLYRLGDSVEGMLLQQVDYRPLPLPENPEILSPSRLILKTGQGFSAVELGQTLDRRRLLSEEQLPEALRTVPAKKYDDQAIQD